MIDIVPQDEVRLSWLFLAANGAVRSGYILLSVLKKQVSTSVPGKAQFGECEPHQAAQMTA